MKAASFLISLLVTFAVCTQIAQALICFTCEDQTSNWACLRMTICPKEAKRCITVGTVSGTGNKSNVLITKKCAQSCPSERDFPNRTLNSIFCCENTWCNIGRPK
nr:lymphocyte antigen 6E-like [Anolis sagrei ordinatus]